MPHSFESWDNLDEEDEERIIIYIAVLCRQSILRDRLYPLEMYDDFDLYWFSFSMSWDTGDHRSLSFSFYIERDLAPLPSCCCLECFKTRADNTFMDKRDNTEIGFSPDWLQEVKTKCPATTFQLVYNTPEKLRLTSHPQKQNKTNKNKTSTQLYYQTN